MAVSNQMLLIRVRVRCTHVVVCAQPDDCDSGVPAGGRDPHDHRRCALAVGLDHRCLHLRRLTLPRVHRKHRRALLRARRGHARAPDVQWTLQERRRRRERVPFGVRPPGNRHRARAPASARNTQARLTWRLRRRRLRQ